MNRAFFAVLFAMLGLCSSLADDWHRADIYFIEWDVTTRIRLTPERVIELADFKRTFHNDAPDFVHSLRLDKLTRAKNKSGEDARLVIVLTDDTLRRHTYYASRFNLCSADNAFKRPIDDQFRQRFSNLAKQQKTK